MGRYPCLFYLSPLYNNPNDEEQNRLLSLSALWHQDNKCPIGCREPVNKSVSLLCLQICTAHSRLLFVRMRYWQVVPPVVRLPEAVGYHWALLREWAIRVEHHTEIDELIVSSHCRAFRRVTYSAKMPLKCKKYSMIK